MTKLSDNYNLQKLCPDLAKEWHPKKNDSLTPKNVVPNSHKKVWWICSKNKNHEWDATINSRSNGKGCPYCSGQKVCIDNCLKTVNPKLAKEWHPKKNDSLTPKNVVPNSHKKVWWICSKNKNHEWDAAIKDRNNGTGCPYCFSRQTSELQLRVYTEMKYVFQDFFNVKHREKPFGYECDVYIPKIKLGIEIDWVYTHLELPKKNKEDKYRSDKEKTEGLSKKGITLLRLREKGLKRISDNDIFWTQKMSHYNICCSILERILDLQKLHDDLISGIKGYINGGKIQNDIEFVNLLDMLPSPLFSEDSLEYSNKTIAREWHPTKNGNLTPRDVYPNSNKKVWWLCSNGHKWEAAIDSRNRGRGCPYCSGRKAGTDNCLKTINPKLAREWHQTKNGKLTPIDVTPNSNKKVWWLCSKNKNHVWDAAISDRNNGTGCPYCSGKKVCINNCLKTVNPKLAKEWHPKKNDSLTPKNVVPNSHKKVWWICSKNKNHEWDATINSRNRGRGCPYCSGRKAGTDNCLKTINPKLAREWHQTKNGKLTPIDVTPNSGRKVWWLCSKNKNHVWEATIQNRNNGTGCPYCFRNKSK